MERVLYDTIKIAVEKTKNNVITVKKDYSECIQRIVKLPYTKINIITGLAGPKGDDGAVYVPRKNNEYLVWEKSEYNNSPVSVNFGALTHSITNSEILAIINS